jgi:hypothetical protein
MIAYNRTGLDNNIVREQAREALRLNCITAEEVAGIQTAYPNLLYTPNIYVRIGLFILTFVIAIFSLGLLALLVHPAEYSAGPLMILAGIGTYGLLEYLVYDMKHFRSGVDDALRWMTAGLLMGGIMIIDIHIGNAGLFFIVLLLSALLCLRFADRLMGVIAFAALLGTLINIVAEFGKTGKIMAPFLAMTVSVVVYLACIPLYGKERGHHYQGCLSFIKTASLAGFYLAGNYFVVRELSIVIFDPYRSGGGTVPMAWFFWAFTLVTPLVYVYLGLRKKDRIFLWVGLASIVAAVFTIRNYYAVLPLEWALSMGGILLIIVAYASTRYLRIPKHGFTHEQTDERPMIEVLHLETLVIAETFTPGVTGTQTGNDFKFGGGSGGGGGAGGDY